MHFCFDTGERVGFKHKAEVIHFCFDTGNFCFDTVISVTLLVIRGYFLANSISNIYY